MMSISEDDKKVFVKNYDVFFKDNLEYFNYILNALNNIYYIAPQFDLKVLSHLCMLTDDDGVAMFNSKIRKDIIKELKCSTQSFSNAINRLKGLNLINGCGGTYKLSPHFIFAGTKEDRTKLLKGDVQIVLNFNIKQE